MLARKKELVTETDFATAKANWEAVDGAYTALMAEVDARRLAISLASLAEGADRDRVPPHLIERAAPFVDLSRRRRSRAIDELTDAVDKLDSLQPKRIEEKQRYDIAARRETDRLAAALQPLHRAAVEKMMRGIEALSAAIAEERDLREELTRTAPLPTSALLPNLSSELLLGTLADFGGPAWKWARRLKQLGLV